MLPLNEIVADGFAEPLALPSARTINALTTARPALQRCLKNLADGGTLIVWKLDRLGRSLRDLITMLDELKKRGVKFCSLTEATVAAILSVDRSTLYRALI